MSEFIFFTYLLAIVAVVWSAYNHYNLKEELKRLEKQQQLQRRLDEMSRVARPTVKLHAIRDPWKK